MDEPSGNGSKQERDDTTTVLIVDDHRSFADALGMAINLQPDLECVGMAGSVEEAIGLVDERAPDVVLMDVHLPDADGIEGTQRVKELNPAVGVLVLTADQNPAILARAAAVGASGFLLKESPFAEILQAIRTTHEGGMQLPNTTLASILERLERGAAPAAAPGLGRSDTLTGRELDVLRLLGQGHDVQTIARDLVISIHTVRGHVKSILAKLGVHSQLEAVVTAVRMGILPRPS